MFRGEKESQVLRINQARVGCWIILAFFWLFWQPSDQGSGIHPSGRQHFVGQDTKRTHFRPAQKPTAS